ncbi:hypothetical protein L9F63_006858, partial [Diploptera punctata]
EENRKFVLRKFQILYNRVLWIRDIESTIVIVIIIRAGVYTFLLVIVAFYFSNKLPLCDNEMTVCRISIAEVV